MSSGSLHGENVIYWPGEASMIIAFCVSMGCIAGISELWATIIDVNTRLGTGTNRISGWRPPTIELKSIPEIHWHGPL